MTVSSSTSRVQFNGNGSTTVFAYSFKIFDEDDLTVIVRSANGTETVKTITTHYTVSGVGNAGGGNVTMLTAPASGETLTILREQDLVQELDLVENDPFPSQSVEDALDKLTFMVQQHEETLGRAIKASRTNTISGSEFTISAADRANKVFAFDSSGNVSIAQELGTYRGNWAAGVAYNQRDLIKDTSNDNIYICLVAHTSTGSQPISSNADVAKWALIVDAATATSSASAASASASAAATSETNAGNSATAASGSASSASSSASSASASAASAAASFDSFDDRYLGAKTSDPSVDNDGNALITGALYFNSVAGDMRVYTGSAWSIAYLPAAGYVTLAGTETLLNKTLDDPKISLGGTNGTSGQMLVSQGSGMAPTWAPQAGEASFTATGTITAGDLVSLLSDGTVIKSTSPEFDTPTQVVASNYVNVSVCHVPGTQKYVVAYAGASGFGNAVVVDYSTGSAVIGTPVVFNSANTELTSCVYHAGQDVVVIAYYDTAATDVEVIAASISGTTLTFGSMVTVTATASTRPVLTVYDSVNQAIVVGYDRTTPYARVFTASGTTLTAGSETQVSTDDGLFSMSFDVAAAKVLFSVGNTSGSIGIRVGTVSGTTLSLGTVYEPTVLRSVASLRHVRLAYSTEEGKTYAFGITGSTAAESQNIAFATVVNISGTNPTFGRIQRLSDIRLASSPGLISTGTVYYSAKENAFYAYGSYSTFDTLNTIQFYKITVDGENYTAEPSYFMPQIVQSTSNNAQAFCIDADGSNLSVVGGGFNATNANTSITRRSLAESTSLNWVGIAKASVTNGQTVTVAVPGGTATGLSSLTPGADYYSAGASYAKAGYDKIGKALSATSMLITG